MPSGSKISTSEVTGKSLTSILSREKIVGRNANRRFDRWRALTMQTDLAGGEPYVRFESFHSSVSGSQ
jgi:hypothetical protein